jgi:hypothetical protein
MENTYKHLEVRCLHPVACTRSGLEFPSNATWFSVLACDSESFAASEVMAAFMWTCALDGNPEPDV